jgi:hypothetical protein
MARVPPGQTDNAATALECGSAMVRAEADHLDVLVDALVDSLSSVPGLEIRVTYRHGRLRTLLGDLPYVNDLGRGTGPTRKLAVTVGRSRYLLEVESCAIKCSVVDASGDEDALTVRDWAKSLTDEIERHNRFNYESITALRNLVELGRVS